MRPERRALTNSLKTRGDSALCFPSNRAGSFFLQRVFATAADPSLHITVGFTPLRVLIAFLDRKDFVAVVANPPEVAEIVAGCRIRAGLEIKSANRCGNAKGITRWAKMTR
jgi:hypothetical protein